MIKRDITFTSPSDNANSIAQRTVSGSSEKWSDKVSLLHIKGTERENTEVKADNITEVPKVQRVTEP